MERGRGEVLNEKDDDDDGRRRRYCVTGASGYIGSWLVKSLLDKGYIVHATVRHPSPDKCKHLVKLRGRANDDDDDDRLRVFRADLNEEGSFDEAVRGCAGVFHVAATLELSVPAEDDVDNYVKSNLIDPAIKGTLNVLKSCLKTLSVKRVVFTSSISTLTAQDTTGSWKPVVDESCQTPIDHVWAKKAPGWVYVLAKRLTEDAAFQFAYEKRIQLASVITTTVAGPFLTPTLPTSIRVLLSPITGDPELFPILSAVNSRMGSIALIHIEDICNAHIFLMEHAAAEGRYICCTQSCTIPELVHRLAKEYPCSNIVESLVKEEHGSIPAEISSKKLTDLGFTYRYDLQDIIQQTIEYSINCGYLPPRESVICSNKKK